MSWPEGHGSERCCSQTVKRCLSFNERASLSLEITKVLAGSSLTGEPGEALNAFGKKRVSLSLHRQPPQTAVFIQVTWVL